ncbi:hypothetical protein FQN49_001064 [Arthroderma sp. PD_2]|nr:hypothetical protein FQN49_001064 [Arthroderma sp. PD_2]
MQDELEPEIWPPIGIPSDYRTQVVDMQEWDNAEHDREMRLSATYRWPCEFLFRYKRLKQPTDILESSVPRWHVTTFASFNREVYTPTPDFPYRGLWVGNFSEIGPEFILFTQFHAPYMDGEIERVASSLFGIKLTREHGMSGSEVAFATHDTSSHGELRIAHENEISGTRVVLAEALNLDDGKFEDAELMLLSHDCVALHWIEDARLSVFKRVLPPKTPDWELGAE